MRGTRFLISALAAAALMAPVAASAATTTVTVDGQVAAPATYTPEQLGDRVSLRSLVDRSSPILPDAKNASLRVTVTVVGRSAVTFAYGELDPSFGNHDAVLLPAARTLVVPGDRNGLRTVRDVRALHVKVSAATPSAGSLVVRDGRRSVTLSPAQLAQLPATTRTVTFQAGTTPQTHTETGPALALVLLRAGFLPTLRTSVAAVGADGYVAAVTPAETFPGGRPLLVSTVEDGIPLDRPRLVADGDVKGGRYVSGLTDLVVDQ